MMTLVEGEPDRLLMISNSKVVSMSLSNYSVEGRRGNILELGWCLAI
jgi:hypothetical protein